MKTQNNYKSIFPDSWSLKRMALTISFLFFYFSRTASMDASHPWQMGFQDPATPIMEGIIFFNGLLMTFMIFIACLVGWLLFKCITLFHAPRHYNSVAFNHSTLLEVVWTVIPAGILMLISIPSYNLLYAMDEVIDPSLTIKVVGHQWYWSYECSDFAVSQESLEASEKQNQALKQVAELQRINLSVYADIFEVAGVEAYKTETQIQLKWVQELLSHLATNVGPLSDEGYHKLISGLVRVFTIMDKHEHSKVSYGDKWYLDLGLHNLGFIESLPDSLIKELWEFELNDEETMVSLDLIRNMQRYARLSGDLELGVHDKEISSFLVRGKKDDDDDGGSSESYFFEEITIMDEDLKDYEYVDELMAFNRWCYTDSKMYNHYRAVTDLERTYSDYLVSQRIVNKAVTGKAEDKNVPVAKCIEDIVRDDGRVRSKRRIMQTEEDKMFDSELMKHQLRFTESEREAFSGRFVLDRESASVGLAQEDFDLALKELNDAKFYWKWSKIVADSAKVNKLTADYLVAEASMNSLDPRMLRSIWLNKRGYYSWNRFIRLVAKKLIEKERTIFVDSQEKLTRANFYLANAQKDLTVEELGRSDAIADDAKDKFMVMEREMVSALEEYRRGELIAEEAQAELKAFEALLEQACERLSRAEKTCEAANKVLIRSEARLEAAKSCFKSLEVNKEESKPSLKPLYVEGNLAELEDRIEELKETFSEGAAEVKEAKSYVFSCEERITDVVKKVIKTETVFENMSLLGIEVPMEGYPKEYFPDYYWEIRRDDVAFIREKLVSEEEKLKLAKASLNALEASANKIGAKIMEAELEVSYLSNSEPAVKPKGWSVDDVRSVEVCKAKAYHSAALEDFKLDPSPVSQNVLDLATNSLAAAKLSKGSELSYKCLDIDKLYLKKGMDPAKMFEDYGKRCARLIKEETPAAMEDYEKAGDLFLKVQRVLKVCSRHLPESSNDPFHFYFTSHFNRISDELKRCVGLFSEDRSNFVSSDITLDSGSIQKKSYEHVLSAKKVLAASKWLVLFIHDVYDIPLVDEVKPFNIEFSHLLEQIDTRPHINRDTYENLEDVALSEILGKKANSIDENKDFLDDQGDSTIGSTDPAGHSSDEEKKDSQGDPVDGMSGDDPAKYQSPESKKPKSHYTKANLAWEIWVAFSFLTRNSTGKESDRLMESLKEAARFVVKTEGDKNQLMKDEIARVKEELEVSIKEKEAEEEFVVNEGINFDSYLIAEEDLVIPESFSTGKAGKVFRLLEVDNRLVIPVNTHIRVLITSADVLHSWAVPSLGVKVDACPGRLNQVFLFVKREGVFYGQCSELCGVNHGFMPIVVQAVSQDEYLSWVGKRLCR